MPIILQVNRFEKDLLFIVRFVYTVVFVILYDSFFPNLKKSDYKYTQNFRIIYRCMYYSSFLSMIIRLGPRTHTVYCYLICVITTGMAAESGNPEAQFQMG